MSDQLRTRELQYRYRAEELRSIADSMRHEFPKEMLQRLAADYETMADNEVFKQMVRQTCQDTPSNSST